MGLLATRLCQRVSERPASLKAPTNGLLRYPHDLSPFCHPQVLSVPAQETLVSFISRLLPCSRPAAVVGRVALRIVDAINRVLRGRARAHVFEKCFERGFPLRADRNPARSIAAIGRFFGIVAALKHVSPNSILTDLVHSVLGIAQPNSFPLKAPAASRGSINQTTRTNDDSFPAGTVTQPSIAFRFHSNWFEHREPSEFLIGEIAKRWHAAIMYQKLRKARV